MSLYADDVTIIAIDINKIKAMWIGAARNEQHSLENIHFENLFEYFRRGHILLP